MKKNLKLQNTKEVALSQDELSQIVGGATASTSATLSPIYASPIYVRPVLPGGALRW
ncbi:MAG TPA: hypothetical protein VM925_24875 [Labilithrix sp.]|jgi:hypothetical protein|nr:hypothetical protein [Labilithrix sp.]